MIELASEFVGDLHMERAHARLVFVTDDHAPRAQLIEAALIGEGFDVIKLSSLAEAATLYASRADLASPLVDLLLVNSNSPLDLSSWDPEITSREGLSIRGLLIGNDIDGCVSLDVSFMRFEYLDADGSLLRNCVSWARSSLADARWDALCSGSTDDFDCPLNEIELADILFQITDNARDATILVQNQRRAPLGYYEFAGGALVYAQTTFHRGRLAALQLLSLTNGYAQVSFSSESEKRLVDGEFTDIASLGLVLRALEINWEAMPELFSTLVVDIAGLTEKLGSLPDDANTVVRACSHRPSFKELLTSLDLDEARIFALVSFLVDEGVLSTESGENDVKGSAAIPSPTHLALNKKNRRRSPTARHFPSPPTPPVESKPHLALLPINEKDESAENKHRPKSVTPTWTGASDSSLSPPTGSLPVQLKQKKRLESAETLRPPGMDPLPASPWPNRDSKDAQGAVSSQGAARAELTGAVESEGKYSDKEMQGGTLQMAILSSVVVSEEPQSEAESSLLSDASRVEPDESRSPEQSPAIAANDQNSPLLRIARASGAPTGKNEQSEEKDSSSAANLESSSPVHLQSKSKDTEEERPEAGKAIFLFARKDKASSAKVFRDDQIDEEKMENLDVPPRRGRLRSSWVAAAAALFAGSLTVAALAIPRAGDENTSIRAKIVDALKAGKKQKAIELLSTLPTPTAADLTQSVELLYETAHPGEALSAADRLLELHPGQARAWLAKGLIYYQRNEYLRASSALRRYLALRPEGENPDRVRILLENVPR